MTTDARRRYQRDVERLLEQVRNRVHELRLVEAHGARGPALATRKHALEQAREELAATIAAGSPRGDYRSPETASRWFPGPETAWAPDRDLEMPALGRSPHRAQQGRRGAPTEGDAHRAARLTAAAERQNSLVAGYPTVAAAGFHRADIETAKSTCDPEVWKESWAAGWAMNLNDAADDALSAN